MSLYTATIKIHVLTEAEKDRYDKVTKEARFLELLDVEIKAPTLEKLQEKITAHSQLVEDLT